MKKTVLITGKASKLQEHLARLYLDAGHNVAVTSGTSAEESESSGLLRLSLNRRSALSNRTCIIDTLSQFEKIDEALVIFTSEGENRPLHELAAAEIEEPVDSSIKAAFFMLKEIIGYFWKQKRGLLSLVLYTYGPEVLTPLDAAAYGSFRALADSLFTYYRNEPVTINGFESESGRTDEFAAFIKQTIDEKAVKTHGRWYQHSERSGFLSKKKNKKKKK